MGITGFIAGAIIGQIVASQILHVEGFASVLCIILCGAFIASLAFWIYRIGIFILCFALAFSAAGTLFPFEGEGCQETALPTFCLSLCKTKSGAHRWSSLCVPHFVLFCTERRTRAPRAVRRESGANHKPLSLFNK